eukprot:234103_1
MATYLPSEDNLNKISKSWELLAATFGNLTHSSENENFLQNNDILLSFENLCNFNLDRSFIDWYYNEIRQYLKEEIVEPFRNKSKNILVSHCKQLKSGKMLIDNDSNVNCNDPQIVLMNFGTFDNEIYCNLLKEISLIITEVYCEIFKIKNNVWQISTLLNALFSKRNNKRNTTNTLNTLNNRLNILIDTIFLMDGSDEFVNIFRIMFEYSFIYFSKIRDETNELMIEFNKICNKLYKLRWLKILKSVFINVGYGHIEYELYSNYKAKKTKHFIDYSMFEQPLLHKFQKWVNNVLIKWLYIITNINED